MRRFRWRLQRVLDITVQRERVLRGEILEMVRERIRLRQEITRRRAALRAMLAEFGRRRLMDRLAEQVIFMECSLAEDEALARLTAAIEDLDGRRAERTEAFRKVRATRRTLERLREEARQDHRRAMEKQQQIIFDELTHIAFARGDVPQAPALLRTGGSHD